MDVGSSFVKEPEAAVLAGMRSRPSDGGRLWAMIGPDPVGSHVSPLSGRRSPSSERGRRFGRPGLPHAGIASTREYLGDVVWYAGDRQKDNPGAALRLICPFGAPKRRGPERVQTTGNDRSAQFGHTPAAAATHPPCHSCTQSHVGPVISSTTGPLTSSSVDEGATLGSMAPRPPTVSTTLSIPLLLLHPFNNLIFNNCSSCPSRPERRLESATTWGRTGLRGHGRRGRCRRRSDLSHRFHDELRPIRTATALRRQARCRRHDRLAADVGRPGPVWERRGTDIAAAPDGSVYVTGSTLNNRGDVLLLKLAPDGTIVWQQRWDGGGTERGGGRRSPPTAPCTLPAGRRASGIRCSCSLAAPTGRSFQERFFGPASGDGLAVSADGSVYVAGTALRPGAWASSTSSW